MNNDPPDANMGWTLELTYIGHKSEMTPILMSNSYFTVVESNNDVL